MRNLIVKYNIKEEGYMDECRACIEKAICKKCGNQICEKNKYFNKNNPVNKRCDFKGYYATPNGNLCMSCYEKN